MTRPPNDPAPTDPLPAPALVHFAHLQVEVAAPIEIGDVGHGQRRVIPITGGLCQARDWQARVLPVGADFQWIVNDHVARLDARYVLETDAGDHIVVHNEGLRTAAPAVMAQLLRGAPAPASEVYFRCTPRFEASARALRWLMERVFVGTGARRPQQVVMRFFEVM